MRTDCVLIGGGDDPGGGVGDAEVEDAALLDEDMEGVHDFTGWLLVSDRYPRESI